MIEIDQFGLFGRPITWLVMRMSTLCKLIIVQIWSLRCRVIIIINIYLVRIRLLFLEITFILLNFDEVRIICDGLKIVLNQFQSLLIFGRDALLLRIVAVSAARLRTRFRNFDLSHAKDCYAIHRML